MVTDRLQLALWEEIGVYQGDIEIQEDTLLGCLVDGDRTVYLTVERVTEICDPQARAALSRAGVCANAGNLPLLHEWLLKAIELENNART